MRRCLAWLLTAMMLLIGTGAYAEGAYSMAGFDGDSTNHVWETNLFFQRMEERTGVTFTFDQHIDYEEWTKVKAAYLSGEREVPDVLFKAGLTGSETQAMLDKGLIIDLKPYLEQYAPCGSCSRSIPSGRRPLPCPAGRLPHCPTSTSFKTTMPCGSTAPGWKTWGLRCLPQRRS